MGKKMKIDGLTDKEATFLGPENINICTRDWD